VLLWHVVLILGESLSGWFLEDRYASVGLGDGVREIAAKGVHVRNFLSSDIGTIGSYSTLVTGLPLPDVPINYQTSAREPYPTSIAPIFKALGYHTRCFYAGFDSWQRIGDFTRAQGFDEVFAAGDFPDLLAGSQWGASDRTLFSEALKRIDPNEPSFSLILTVSNHSPFEIDIKKEGWSRTSMPSDLADIDDGTADWFALGHAWYASRCIGEFVSQAEQRLGDGFTVAITGDHYGRRFLNGRPTRWERTMVPFIGYGAGFRDVTVPDGALGTHVDMVTTLIERCAPAGFVYHAWGHDLLTPRRAPAAFGRWCALDAEGVIDFKEPVHERDVRWIQREAAYRDQAALSWWRVMRGSALPP
jgi:phosphoglycerol transferase MdoB-like AlkP superfamily enzyme